MSARLRFHILGCGSSGGVPRIGGHWGDCDPTNPKNRRRRCSMLVERETDQGVTRVLIDTSPDMREETQGDFWFAQQSGITGFPTLLAVEDQQATLVTAGYLPWDALEKPLAGWVAGEAPA